MWWWGCLGLRERHSAGNVRKGHSFWWRIGFLGLAVMQVHGDQVVLGLAVATGIRICIAPLVHSGAVSPPGSGAAVQQLGLSHSSHLQGCAERGDADICGDQPAHRQWCKLVETRTSLSNGCVCLAARTAVRPRQPPPPTHFSLQF